MNEGAVSAALINLISCSGYDWKAHDTAVLLKLSRYVPGHYLNRKPGTPIYRVSFSIKEKQGINAMIPLLQYLTKVIGCLKENNNLAFIYVKLP